MKNGADYLCLTDMDKLAMVFFCVLLNLGMPAAQEVATITASFKRYDRQPMDLSAGMIRQLFIQKKGDLNIPAERVAHYVYLSRPDAKRLGRTTVALVHINGMEPLDVAGQQAHTGKPLRYRIHPLIGYPGVYYTDDVDYFLQCFREDYPGEMPFDKQATQPDPLERVLFDPAARDTLLQQDVFGEGKMRYTGRFIELLENDREVLIRGVTTMRTTGGDIVNPAIKQVKLSECARRRLVKINLWIPGMDAPGANASRSDWLHWFREIQEY